MVRELHTRPLPRLGGLGEGVFVACTVGNPLRSSSYISNRYLGYLDTYYCSANSGYNIGAFYVFEGVRVTYE